MRTAGIRIQKMDASITRFPKPVQRHRTLIASGLAIGALAVFLAFVVVVSGKRVSTVEELRDYLRSRGYTADVLRTSGPEVPPLYVTGIPADWSDGLPTDVRKNLFFRLLLPLVLLANAEIQADRQRLLSLRDAIAADRKVKRADHAWLRDLADRYKARAVTDADGNLSGQEIATLVARVDIVPPSLALAQGAIESAYGSSRFAAEGNALFGQWHFGKGLRPEDQRSELGDYRIAQFDSPLESVRAYMRNLNTNGAYRIFRLHRAEARRSGQSPSGPALAAGLKAYSEKGDAYVTLLRDLIHANRLSGLDGARLREARPVRIIPGLL
jgi:Bax protein